MDTVDFTRFIFAFLFVVGLIGLFGFALKRYVRTQKIFGGGEASGRLRIVETRFIDPRRKLVLIRRDDKEHLILLSDGREMLIESNIVSADTAS